MSLSHLFFYLLCFNFLVYAAPPGELASTGRKPNSNPRNCRNRCFQNRQPAEQDCRFRNQPVEGCQVVPCEFENGKERSGWACAPISEPSFTSLTFRAGERYTGSDTVAATDGSSDTFDVNFDVKLTEPGVVSLDGVADYATVTCFNNATVRVQLDAGVSLTTIQQMYPVNAVLAVSRDIYGECRLAPAIIPSDESDVDREVRAAFNNENIIANGFLIIESVTGSVSDAFIVGSVAPYYALFEEGSLSIVPSTNSSSSRQVVPYSEKAVSLEFDNPIFTLGPLELSVKGQGAFTGGFVSFDASWDWTGVDVEFKFIHGWKITLSLDAQISVAVGTPSFAVKELLSVPLWAIPPIDFLSKLDTGKFHLPEFKLGFYFEIPLVMSVEALLQKPLGSVASVSYETGKTEVTMYVRGSYLNLDIGADTKTLAPRDVNYDFLTSLSATEPVEVVVDVFLGIRPQFAAYIPLFYARASLEVGVQVEGKWAPGADNAFPPLSGGGIQFGICKECHDVEIAGRGKVQNAGLYAGISFTLQYEKWGFNISIPLSRSLLSLTLPGNPFLSVDIATGCFIEPIGTTRPLTYLEPQNKCLECPDEKPRYNPTRKECEKDCPDPAKPFFNTASGQCEACPAETPVYNTDLQVCEGTCPGGTRSGNDVPFYGSFELGSPNGTFVFSRTHYTIKDQMQVFYEGNELHNTGCTGGTRSVTLSYSGTATNVIVKVTPNCAGSSGTAWNFRVFCPS